MMMKYRLILSLLFGCMAWNGAAQEKPNILLILADDLGYSDIGSFGGEIPTPSLDALAQSGIRLAQFYNHARCCPTRASLLTGLDNHQTGIGNMTGEKESDPGLYGYTGVLNNDCVTIAEVLRTAGYHTYMTGKWHVAGPGGRVRAQYPLRRGFDRYYGIIAGATNYFSPKGNSSIYSGNEIVTTDDPDFYTTNAFTDQALRFLKEQNDDRPFFLYLAFNAAHMPLLAPAADIEKMKSLYIEGWDVVRQKRMERIKQLGLIPEQMPVASSRLKPWTTLGAEKRTEEIKKMTTYAAMVHVMDRNIGRVMDYLKQSGKAENTLIIYLSDNGATFHTDFWNLCNAPFSGRKRQTLEGGIATHAIVSWPQRIIAQKGKITQVPADIIDVMPTILDITKAAYPATVGQHQIHPLEGRSLLPVLTSGRDTASRWFFWEHDNNYGVRNGSWKAVKLSGEKAWALYNLKTDRGETKDLSDAYPDRLGELTGRWQKWADRHFVFPKPLAAQTDAGRKKNKRKR